MQASTESEMGEDSNDDPADNKLQDGNPINILSEKSSGVPFQNERRCHSLFQSRYIAPHFIKTQCDTMTDDSKYQDSHIHKISNNCHSLVLILILISIKTRIGNIFRTPPPPHPTPPGTQLCLILTKLLTFQVNHQNKSCLSILE